jgi:hypothetical protein
MVYFLVDGERQANATLGHRELEFGSAHLRWLVNQDYQMIVNNSCRMIVNMNMGTNMIATVRTERIVNMRSHNTRTLRIIIEGL